MLTDINELWIRYLLLSEQFHYIQHFILFQYISCYSLSKCPDSKCYSINVSIHLMLLFISLRPYRPSGRRRVSIHLMLLFIRNWHEWKNCVRRVSIHLMLLFIASSGMETGTAKNVSIHLILLFIF